MMLFIASLLCYGRFSVSQTPQWLGIVSGITILGAIISGAICITAAICIRLKSGKQVDDGHEKDVD
jgi:hypothetical protein